MFSWRSTKPLLKSFPLYKVGLFSTLLKAQIVDIEYPLGICSLIFVVEYYSGLFVKS